MDRGNSRGGSSVSRGPLRPRVGDAAGWRESSLSERYPNVTIEEPTGLTVTDTVNEWRFSYVSERVVLRNWFRLRAEGHRTRYFYGETAMSDVQREAGDLDWEIRASGPNGWA